MKYLICLFTTSLLLAGCKPSAGNSSISLFSDSVPASPDTSVTAGAANSGYPVYWTDSLTDPMAWINSEMLMTQSDRGMDTFLLDGGEFHKSLEPTLRAVQVNGKGRKEIVVDFASWNTVNDYDTEKDVQSYFRDEEKKCIEIYDADAGKLIFTCCYYFRETLEENDTDSIPGQTFIHTDSTYYEYKVKIGQEMIISDPKGYSEPDYSPGRYVWKGTGFVKVKMN
jgi:hypothetical protein